jgi:PhnB protein
MASHAPPEWAGKVCHATLTLGENILMGADPAPGNYVKPGGFHILIAIGDVSEAERIFAALSENGSVQTPLQKTFWAERFGVLTDQFGVPWEVNCEKPAS